MDIFEDFLGSPLLSNKIEENYEVVAQLLTEVCDGGIICNTEPNALRETVEVSSVLGKLFNQVGLPRWVRPLYQKVHFLTCPSSAPSIGGPASLSSSLKPSLPANQPSIPWRRPNVRHTSNELYVDILESLQVISSPSGRPISARATGSILFTAKISGVPDILLSLTAPGGTSQAKHSGIQRTMALPSFHPCVRLNKWSESPGELSFIPPDGKFMLAGYEVDLLPYSFDSDTLPTRGTEGKLFLPATVDLRTGLGPSGMDFEAKVTLNTNFPGTNKQSSSTSNMTTSSSLSSSTRPTALTNTRNNSGPSSTLSGSSPFSFGPSTTGTTSAPTLDSVSVTIPFPGLVRNVTELRPSRGDATFNVHTKMLEWRIPTNSKDAGSISGTATLSGSISGPISSSSSASDTLHDYEDGEDTENIDPTISEYYTSSSPTTSTTKPSNQTQQHTSPPKRTKSHLLPRTISTSFTVKGWLPSGIKVESLAIDVKKSRGLGDGVKPYKGVKYVCVSRRGVERRVDLR